MSYGGNAGNGVMIDGSGKVTAGNDAPSGDLPDDGTVVTDEEGATSGASPEFSTDPPGEDPCGNTAELPVAVTREGTDFVISIDGESTLAKQSLSITTLSRGEGADIVVSFAPVDGLMCALGTSSE
ncbi:hypothetical protein [Nocardioides sp. B-3]|uniref:hypothetical protein n=1 Tax=Nocardioides sp. B-3 TaxID=2895565 RepID=UPI00215265FD|nr:hypothetical protein [Nocardioides sp. B-3]UUZ59114.1 hypothetical protein LP418_24750 [Nocardioides sp. B-3]